MSNSTRTRYVAAQAAFDFTLPEEGQTICRILKGLGNNTYMAETPDGDEYILSMPKKFRRRIIVSKGCFVVTEPIAENKKVKGEIVRILLQKQIKFLFENNAWPKTFENTPYLYHNRPAHMKDKRAVSDRGFVHGKNVLCYASDKVMKSTENEPEDNESDSDSYSDLEPNLNRKAVSKFVYSDDEDDDCSDTSDDDCADDHECNDSVCDSDTSKHDDNSDDNSSGDEDEESDNSDDDLDKTSSGNNLDESAARNNSSNISASTLGSPTAIACQATDESSAVSSSLSKNMPLLKSEERQRIRDMEEEIVEHKRRFLRSLLPV